MKRPVIVIPGYYGSKLAESVTGEVVWLTTAGLLHPAATLRALRFDPDDPDRVVPVDILEDVPLILPFWNIKVYEGLLDFLNENLKLPPEWVLPFYYDWRRSFGDAVDSLANQIRRLLTETDSEKVHLIAHSFGGLVARACLRKHGLADRVDWLITLGVPHKGMQRTFRTLTKGAEIFTFTPAEARKLARDLPSAYELVPNDGADGLFTVNGNRSDAFADNSWCEDQRMRDLLAAAGSTVSNLLPPELPVKTCFVYGTRLETTTHAQSDGAGALKFVKTTDGDGTVPRVSALGQGLAGVAEVLRFQVPFAVHSQMPNDELVQQSILTPILLGRPFPAVTVFIRFLQQPFFIPQSSNPLAVAVAGPNGDPVPDARVRLTIVGTTIRDRQIPFDATRGDYALDVTMPGPSVPHRQWRIEVEVPGQPKMVEHGLLVRAA